MAKKKQQPDDSGVPVKVPTDKAPTGVPVAVPSSPSVSETVSEPKSGQKADSTKGK